MTGLQGHQTQPRRAADRPSARNPVIPAPRRGPACGHWCLRVETPRRDTGTSAGSFAGDEVSTRRDSSASAVSSGWIAVSTRRDTGLTSSQSPARCHPGAAPIGAFESSCAAGASKAPISRARADTARASALRNPHGRSVLPDHSTVPATRRTPTAPPGPSIASGSPAAPQPQVSRADCGVAPVLHRGRGSSNQAGTTLGLGQRQVEAEAA